MTDQVTKTPRSSMEWKAGPTTTVVNHEILRGYMSLNVLLQVEVRSVVLLFEPLSQSVLFLFSWPLPFFPLYLRQQWSIMTKYCSFLSLFCLCLQDCDISSFHIFSHCIKHCLSLYLLRPFPFILGSCLPNASFPNAFASCPNLLLFSTKLLYRFTFSILLSCSPSFSL